MSDTDVIIDAEVVEETPAPKKTVDWEVVRKLMEDLGLTENDLVQKIEISTAGVLITCAFTAEGKRFTIETPEGDESELTYHRFLAIKFPEQEPLTTE